MLSLFRKLTVLFCEGEATETSVTAAPSETKKLIIRDKKSQLKTRFDSFLSCCHSTKVDFEKLIKFHNKHKSKFNDIPQLTLGQH